MRNCAHKSEFGIYLYDMGDFARGREEENTIYQETLKLTQHATYVNNGINMAELKEIVDRTDKVEHPFTVYTLGRICYQKNPTMFNAIAELLPDVKFVWIGDGELRKELTSENIEITGWADRATAIKYAVNADVFLLPSRWEGLPISLLESMYIRNRVDVDLIREHVHGFLIAILFHIKLNCHLFIANVQNSVRGNFLKRKKKDVRNHEQIEWYPLKFNP